MTDTTNESAETDAKTEILNQLAKKEDVSDFIAESRDRAAENDGETLPPEREADRVERYREAIKVAREEATQDETPSEPQAPDPHEHQEPAEDMLERERHKARAQVRFEQFEAQNPELADTVKAAFSVYKAGPTLAQHIVESPLGPEIAARFATNAPELIEEFNAQPPEVQRYMLAQLEGGIYAQRNFEAQQRGIPPRRETKVPPPMRKVTGGANEPKNLHELAKATDITEFVKASRRLEKARASR
jgi:hypothetical protein